MKKRNPIAKAVRNLRPKVVQDKREKIKESEAEKFMKKLFSNPEIRAVYERLRDR